MSERISTSSSSLCSSFSNCRLQSTSGTRRGRNALSHLGGITRPSSSSPHGDSGCTTKSSHEVGSLTLQTHISWVKPIFCFSKTNKKGSECFNGHEAAKMTVALFPLVDTLENLNPVLDLREVCQGLNSSHLATKRNPRTFQPKIPPKIPQSQEVSPYSESVFPVVPGPVPRRQKSAWLTPTCPCRHLPPPQGRSEARRIPRSSNKKQLEKKYRDLPVSTSGHFLRFWIFYKLAQKRFFDPSATAFHKLPQQQIDVAAPLPWIGRQRGWCQTCRVQSSGGILVGRSSCLKMRDVFFGRQQCFLGSRIGNQCTLANKNAGNC